jgi:hypothetical protein
VSVRANRAAHLRRLGPPLRHGHCARPPGETP